MSLLIERKQIPQIDVIARTLRKPMAPLETIPLPWAQGAGRSNRPAPTNKIQLFPLGRGPRRSKARKPHWAPVFQRDARSEQANLE